MLPKFYIIHLYSPEILTATTIFGGTEMMSQMEIHLTCNLPLLFDTIDRDGKETLQQPMVPEAKHLNFPWYTLIPHPHPGSLMVSCIVRCMAEWGVVWCGVVRRTKNKRRRKKKEYREWVYLLLQGKQQSQVSTILYTVYISWRGLVIYIKFIYKINEPNE